MNKNCKQCGAEFEITDSDLKFYDKISPVIAGKRQSVPEPTFCPDCRMQRRFAFRNERNLYKRKSDLSGKEIVTCYHPDENVKVYEQDEWWGDKWEGCDFGMDYDFNKRFFEQFDELQKKVPMIALHTVNNQNSQYVNYTGECKDCYMIFGPVYSEDCLYGSPYYSKNCIDSLLVRDSQFCYQCITCEKCYQCFFSQDCVNSDDLSFCYDCHGCSDCIACTGLRNKKHQIFNKQYTPEDYEEKKKMLDFSSMEQLENISRKFKDQKLHVPRRYSVEVSTENCTGNYIYQSKTSNDCYDVQRAWDCRYLAQTIDTKDCCDCNYTEENELAYEYMGYYRDVHCMFSIVCANSSDVFYSAYCMSCKNCFGCIGLRHKEYCILNKQYAKDEYEELLPKIIEKMRRHGEWGEYFPIKISPFCYNETVANEYFPLSEEEAIKRGFRWRQKDKRDYQKPHGDVLACASCGKNYKLQKAEEIFYKRYHLPSPEKCPDCRHIKRLSMRPPRKLWDRECSNCKKSIRSSYSPNQPEIIYCDECYLKQTY